MTPSTEAALQAMSILRNWKETGTPRKRTPETTFEQERREALDAVLESLDASRNDPDHQAACRLLLRHLKAAAANPVRI